MDHESPSVTPSAPAGGLAQLHAIVTEPPRAAPTAGTRGRCAPGVADFPCAWITVSHTVPRRDRAVQAWRPARRRPRRGEVVDDHDACSVTLTEPSVKQAAARRCCTAWNNRWHAVLPPLAGVRRSRRARRALIRRGRRSVSHQPDAVPSSATSSQGDEPAASDRVLTRCPHRGSSAPHRVRSEPTLAAPPRRWRTRPLRRDDARPLRHEHVRRVELPAAVDGVDRHGGVRARHDCGIDESGSTPTTTPSSRSRPHSTPRSAASTGPALAVSATTPPSASATNRGPQRRQRAVVPCVGPQLSRPSRTAPARCR